MHRQIVLVIENYIKKVLECFGMHDYNLVSTPLAAYFILSATLSP